MLVTNTSNLGVDVMLLLLVVGNLVHALIQWVRKYRGSLRR
jgi:hypothetical protein